uniref:N-acetyltransferase domain-containing protein n=1 Tax=Phytophthora ramorum TaxID=164328 RepID=H3G547_PHYRM
GPVDRDNVQRLRELNLQLFPVRYNLAFYKEVALVLNFVIHAASRLLEGVIAQSTRDGVVQVYLHVQTSNTAALRFYVSHGFEATQILRNYYKHIEPPDCYVLRRQL